MQVRAGAGARGGDGGADDTGHPDWDFDYFIADEQRTAAPPWDQSTHDAFVFDYMVRFGVHQASSGERRRVTADALEADCVRAGKQCTGCLSYHCVRENALKTVTVTLVSVFTALNVEVPVFYCNNCKAYTHVSPLAIGYFPGTFDHAVKLHRARSGSPVIWFDIELLRLLASLQARINSFDVPPPVRRCHRHCSASPHARHGLPRTDTAYRLPRILSDTQDHSPQLATKAFCEAFVETATVGASTRVAAKAASTPVAGHPELRDGTVMAEGGPSLSVSTLRERLGEMMPAYRHFALTLAKRSTLGVDHPLERGLLGACAACHTAGEPICDASGTPMLDESGDVKRVPLHSIQADGCMTGIRFAKSAPRRDAAGSAPPFVERVLPIEEAEGAAFRPGDTNIPGRGMRALCDTIDRHSGRQRAQAEGDAHQAPSSARSCSDFVAANAPADGGSSRALFDTFGFFGMFCRHRVLLLGCHMFSGERRAYLIGLLWVFLTIHKVVITNIEYDIGACQWMPGLLLFLTIAGNVNDVLPEEAMALLRACLSDSQSPLMAFHFYCHRVLCQLKNDAWLMPGTAVQHGEGTEMKWSLFNRLTARVKGMGKAARYGEIDYWWGAENMRQDVREQFAQASPLPCRAPTTIPESARGGALFLVRGDGLRPSMMMVPASPYLLYLRANAAVSLCPLVSHLSQGSLPNLLIGWYGDVLDRKDLYIAQLAAARSIIQDKGLDESVCLEAASQARAELLSGFHSHGASDLSDTSRYALALVKHVIASSKGGRGGVLGIPAGLIHRDATGRIPAPGAGLIIVPVTASGERRRKSELASLKAKLGVATPWHIQGEPFLTSFAAVRTVMVAQLQSELFEQLSLLHLLGYGGKSLGPDARRAQKKNVIHQETIASKLLGRLRLWMRGGFLGLASAVPEGALAGEEWQGHWTDDQILKEKMTPWAAGGVSAIIDTPAELGCVVLLLCCVPVVSFLAGWPCQPQRPQRCSRLSPRHCSITDCDRPHTATPLTGARCLYCSTSSHGWRRKSRC